MIKCNVFPIPGLNGSTIVFCCSSAAQLQQPDIAEPVALGRLMRGEDWLEICMEKLRLYFVWVVEKLMFGFSQPCLGNLWPVLSSATNLWSSLILLTFLDLGLQGRWSFFLNSERRVTWRDACWRKFHFYLFIVLTYFTGDKHAEAYYFKKYILFDKSLKKPYAFKSQW